MHGMAAHTKGRCYMTAGTHMPTRSAPKNKEGALKEEVPGECQEFSWDKGFFGPIVRLRPRLRPDSMAPPTLRLTITGRGWPQLHLLSA